MRRVGIVTLVLLLSSGCIMIPIPSREQVVTGQHITSPVVDSIVPGLTTRTDLLERLGKPYTTLDKPHVLVYPWTMAGGGLLWVSGFTSGGAGGFLPLHYQYALLIALDETEHVTRREITRRSDWDSLREHAYKWAQTNGLTGEHRPEPFALRPIPPGQSVLYVYRSGGFWDAPSPFMAAIILENQVLAELGKDAYTSVVLPSGNHDIIVSPDARNPASPYAQRVTRIRVQTSPDQATFLRVKIPHGFSDLTPLLTLPSETEAIKELSSRVTSW